MKHLLLFAACALVLSLSSCQCSNKPDVGPVEDAQAAVSVEAGARLV